MTDATHTDATSAGDVPGNTPTKQSPRVGRRALMLGATAAGVGGAAVLVPGAGIAAAATGGDVLLGKKNTAGATTTVTLTGDTSGEPAVLGADATTGTGGGAGIQGTSKHGTGVFGQVAGATTGQRAVFGIDETSGGGYGIVGTSDAGIAVYGRSTGGDGVQGFTTNNGSNALYGDDTSTGGGYGVYGSSLKGTGVSGNGVAPGKSGVYGAFTGETGYGVYGFTTGGDAIGVYGYATTGNQNAVVADGNAAVTGSLSKGGGSFKIDHPVDPEGKYLYHSFVESPDMMNVYNGAVTLDGRGQATVELPGWFEALNRDYRYQLTALLGAAPDLHVSALVADGKFSIAGGKAGQQVSWQVTGIRQDAWANANRIPVEVEKPEEDKGRYLHPELFGGEAITNLASARDHGRRTRQTTTA